ncbi:solute carrier family 25 [Capsaspora owczarzaki ATCC 30864]|uniref:Solute carrier family 25 n=1 Tax=Capsaspora owczarzaki (strain ATCC 30864) TaxID=595528 RepID=A0A0D2VGF8_CAPO3|nr:solute carrier family 25 [Capsaspora owczarzaki ATCC 30864]
MAMIGVFQGLRAIGQKEGLLGYYKGNGAMMARIFPYAAIQFMSYEQYKKLLKSYFNGRESPVHRLLAGSLAGVTCVTFTYPLDLVRARLAFQVSENRYTGIAHAFRTIYAEEGGLRAMFSGFRPTIYGMIPYAGLSFFTNETLKAFFLENMTSITTKPVHKRDGTAPDPTLRELTYTTNLLCGGIAGGVAQTFAYPFDVVRRRMQLNRGLPDGQATSTIRTLVYILRHDGFFRGWYRGMSLNYMRVVPQAAVSFTTYEFLKRMLQIEDRSIVKVG